MTKIFWLILATGTLMYSLYLFNTGEKIEAVYALILAFMNYTFSKDTEV